MKYKAAKGKDHMDLPQNNAVQSWENMSSKYIKKNKKKTALKGVIHHQSKKYLFKQTVF